MRDAVPPVVVPSSDTLLPFTFFTFMLCTFGISLVFIFVDLCKELFECLFCRTLDYLSLDPYFGDLGSRLTAEPPPI